MTITQVTTAFLTIAVLVIAAVAQPARSQITPDVNCAALRGSPMMCVKNASVFPIVAIQALNSNAFNPNAWINIPGGDIRPGGTAIVKFPAYAGGCIQTIFVRTATGNVHPFSSVNVCSSTSLTIRGF